VRRPVAPVALAPTPAPVFAPAPGAVPEPVVAAEPRERTSGVEQVTMAMPPINPPASGFVQSVSLGELGGTQMEADVELVEPGEFNLPGFDSFGEREDDHDIEEID